MGCGSSSEAPKGGYSDAAAKPESAPAGGAKDPMNMAAQPRGSTIMVSNLDAKMRNVQACLQEIPPYNVPEGGEGDWEQIRGTLDVQITVNQWKDKVTCQFNKGMLEVRSGDGSFSEDIAVSYIEHVKKPSGDISDADQAYFAHLEQQGAMNAFKVFSPGSTWQFRAETEEGALVFVNGITKWMNDCFGADSLRTKANALSQFNPLLRLQFNTQWTQIDSLNKKLAATGLTSEEDLPIHSADKDKCGTLKIEQPGEVGDGRWKEYYFVLFDSFLYYYLDSKANDPAGLVSLKYASVELDIKSIKENKRFNFKIHTPMRTMTLRTKHQVALAEWIVGLETTLSKVLAKGGVTVRTPDEVLEEIRELTGGKEEEQRAVAPLDQAQFIYIAATTDGKTKEFSLPKAKEGSTATQTQTVGRDPSNDIVIDDKKISRSHARFEYTDSVCTLVDLGSTAGCKMNDKRVLKAKLQVGDKIKMGDTILEVLLKPKGKYAK